jgi:hypothetical protein
MAVPTTRRPFLDNRGRARWTKITLGAVALVNGVDAIEVSHWLWAGSSLLGLVEDHPWVLAAAWLRLATAILFVAWFHRAYANAWALGLRGAPAVGWAIGGWIMPFLNLVYPFHIASAMWRQATAERVGSSAIVGVWWAALLIGHFGDGFGNSMVARANSTQSGMQVLLASALLGVTSTVLAIVIVRRLTAAQIATHDMRLAEVFD